MTNERIITALLANPTNAAAAKELAISESYLYQRMKTAAFQDAFKKAKSVMFASFLETAQRQMMKSLDTITEIRDDVNNAPSVRLAAAQAIIQTVTRLQDAASKERIEREEAAWSIW